jgi:hypothetical protein
VGTTLATFSELYSEVGTTSVTFNELYNKVGTTLAIFNEVYSEVGTPLSTFSELYSEVGTLAKFSEQWYRHSKQGPEDFPGKRIVFNIIQMDGGVED